MIRVPDCTGVAVVQIFSRTNVDYRRTCVLFNMIIYQCLIFCKREFGFFYWTFLLRAFILISDRRVYEITTYPEERIWQRYY